MTNDPKLALKTLVASSAAKGTRDMATLLVGYGFPPDAVAAGIFGEAMRLFARDQGWEEAAKLCEEMARQARMLDRPGAAELARSQPAGRA